MEPAVQELLNSPKLALHVRKLGDVLAREHKARERFYDEIDEDQKAEFINGKVIVHSPAKKRHIDAIALLLRLLHPYVQINGLGYVGQEKVLITLTRNDYEPDVCFFSAEKADRFTPDQMKFPAPDLAVEVLSPSTAEHDRGVKFEDYAAHGVAEYWIVDPELETVEQYVLEGERYALQMKSGSGELVSVAVAGFEIPVRALFDDAENLRVLRQLLQSD